MGMASFGDKVQIRDTAETRAYRLASEVGQVLGESVPSSSSVGPVIGDRGEDRALCVEIERNGQLVWLAPHLVEFLDHQAGLTMSLDGGPTYRRRADGTWQENGGPTDVGATLNPGGGVARRLPGGLGAVMRWLSALTKSPRDS